MWFECLEGLDQWETLELIAAYEYNVIEEDAVKDIDNSECVRYNEDVGDNGSPDVII